MQGIILILLAILTALPIIIKNRVRSVATASPAVFSAYSSQNNIQVLISGSVKHSGLYKVAANTLTSTAIKMAGLVEDNVRIISDGCSSRYVNSGDHLYLTLNSDSSGIIRCDVMNASQRILLGIPLDVNLMTVADFESLPGIGPIMAQRIVEYRQKNGGKLKYEDLLLVEGVGEKKLRALARYF